MVQIAKKLPEKQCTKLIAEVEAKPSIDSERGDFKKFLLKGPTFSTRQLETIAETRKSINQ